MNDHVQKVEIVGRYHRPGGLVMATFCIVTFLALAVGMIYGAYFA